MLSTGHSVRQLLLKLMIYMLTLQHGRPEDADPTLQQWIGDSATIPCTPDVRPSKPKKKSPRWVQLMETRLTCAVDFIDEESICYYTLLKLGRPKP